MTINPQFYRLHGGLQHALAAGDWERVELLDKRLQQYLQVAQRFRSDPAVKNEIEKLQLLYSQIVQEAEKEQERIKQQLNQQAHEQEGMVAYLQNS